MIMTWQIIFYLFNIPAVSKIMSGGPVRAVRDLIYFLRRRNILYSPIDVGGYIAQRSYIWRL